MAIVRYVFIACLFACLATSAFASPSNAGSPDSVAKHWTELRDHPIDYSRFEERRKELAKENGPKATGVLALGFANRVELGSYPVIEDPKLKAALEAYVAKLIPPGITPPHIEVIVVDDLGIRFSLATVAPGQDDALELLTERLSSDYYVQSTEGAGLIVSLGTLHATKTPDELNFLLAHEISHILLDHFRSEEREKTFRQIASLGLVAAAVAGRQGSNGSARTAVAATLGAVVASHLLERQWDRDQEREADEMGSELLVEFGHYSPDGAYHALTEIDGEEKRQAKALDELCGPEDAGTRILETLIGVKQQHGRDPNNPACAVRKDLFADLFKNHPTAADRLANLKAYQAKVYPDAQGRDVTVFIDSHGRPVDNFVAFASPDGDANRLAEAYEGLDDVRDHNLTAARAIVHKLGDCRAKETLAPVLMLGTAVALADGKRAAAIKCLKRATEVAQFYPEAFQLLAQMYEDDKRWADAADLIQNWQIRAGYAPEFYPRLIADLRQAGKKDDMQSALDSCRQVSDANLVAACEAAAVPQPPASPGDAATPGASHGI